MKCFKLPLLRWTVEPSNVMTIYEGFQVFMAVADHSMVRWVSRGAVDECCVVSEETTASVLRVNGCGSRGCIVVNQN